MQFTYTQTKLAQIIANSFFAKTNSEISIKKVRLSYFNRVVIEDIYLADHQNDTLLYSREVDLGFNIRELIQLNFKIQSLCFTNPYLNLNKKEDLLNMQFLIDYFSNNDSSNKEVYISFLLNHFEIIDGRFSYHDFAQEKDKDGFDNGNIDVVELNLYLNELEVDSNDIKIAFCNISLKEKEFEVKKFNSAVNISEQGIELTDLHIHTKNSELKGDIALKTTEWSDYEKFLSKVKIESRFLSSVLSTKDISYFSPDISGMDQSLNFSGQLTGTIDNLSGKGVKIDLDDHIKGLIDFKFNGLPNIEETFFHVKIQSLTSSKNEIERIHIPPFEEKKHLQLPENLSHLGQVNFSGKLSGYLSDFVVHGHLKTEIGEFVTDLKLRNDSVFRYNGAIECIEFDAGKFFENEKILGKISLTAEIEGKGINKSDLDASIDGNIKHITFNNYKYNDIQIAGDFQNEIFKGEIFIQDPNLELVFAGEFDLSNEEKQLNFKIDLKNLYPNIVFGMDHIDRSAHISSSIEVNLSVRDIDNLNGEVEISNTVYVDKDVEITSELFSFISNKLGSNKSISVRSDIMDFDLSGRYDMLDGFKSIKSLLIKYFPNAIDEEIIVDKEFTFNLDMKDYRLIEKLISPGISINPGSMIKGKFDSKNDYLDLQAKAYQFTIGSVRIDTSLIHIYTSNQSIKMDARISHYSLGGKTQKRVIEISSSAEENQIESELKSHGNGPFSSNISLHNYVFDHNTYGFKFLNTHFSINDTIWTLDDSNFVMYDSTSWSFKDFDIGNNDQQIGVNGKISHNSWNNLNITLNNFNLNVLNSFINDLDLEFGGILNGEANVRNVYADILFESDISFNDLAFNKKKLGNGYLKSKWDDKGKKLDIEGIISSNKLKKLEIKGSYYTLKEKSPLNFDLKIDDLPLSVLEPLTQNIISEFEGTSSGLIQLRGSMKSPDLKGLIYLKNAKARVDYTNVVYEFKNASDSSNIVSILLNPDSIYIPKFNLFDKFGQSGTGSITFLHNRFENFATDLKINANNLFVLNTNAEQNKLYYGKCFVSGDIELWAEKGLSKINMDIKTENKTEFNLPLNESSEVSENQFIVFKTKEETVKIIDENDEDDAFNVELEINLEATTDAMIRLVFDEKSGDVIEARGFGNLKLDYDPKNSLKMKGEYEILTGNYIFSLQTIVNKKFEIEPGSKIKWNGDPYKGEMDITTAYKTRARLYDILPEVDPDVNYKKNVPVNLRLRMTQSIESPIVGFEIFLPESRQSVRQQLQSEVSNENCLNRQVFSLLILQAFTPCETKEESASTSNVGKSTAYEAMSNQLSGLLSQINDDVDIGVSYQPEVKGDDYSPEQLEIAVSTQLFNDRIIIDGNASNGNQIGSNAETKWAGEFSVEYKIRPDGKLRVKAFNQVNDRSYIENDNLYIQGVGLKYSLDFDSPWSRMWRRKTYKESEIEKELESEDQ